MLANILIAEPIVSTSPSHPHNLFPKVHLVLQSYSGLFQTNAFQEIFPPKRRVCFSGLNVCLFHYTLLDFISVKMIDEIYKLRSFSLRSIVNVSLTSVPFFGNNFSKKNVVIKLFYGVVF